MNAPSKDVVEILESSTKGLDLVYETNLFRTEMPDEPDYCACVNDSGGYEPQSGYVYEYPTFQVLTRAGLWKYDDAYALIQQIKRVLHGLHGEVWGGSKYIGIWAMGDIIPLGYDEGNRPRFSLNFRVHRTDT